MHVESPPAENPDTNYSFIHHKIVCSSNLSDAFLLCMLKGYMNGRYTSTEVIDKPLQHFLYPRYLANGAWNDFPAHCQYGYMINSIAVPQEYV